MNWRATALTLITIGVASVAGGFYWRASTLGAIDDCETLNILRGRFAEECPSTTPAFVTIAIGAVLAVIGVALLAGTTRPNASSSG